MDGGLLLLLLFFLSLSFYLSLPLSFIRSGKKNAYGSLWFVDQ